jgi:phosphoenolpyruvate-protein kinase (PTS system EI component)
MIVEIVLGIAVLIEGYVIWNLTRKTEMLETWVEGFSNSVTNVSEELKEIDATGHFEADDEIGSIFTGIKEIINDLQETLGEEVDAT